MTDLPDEGVVVLAFNGQHFGFARCRDGKWYARFGEKEIAPPDLWVPLPLARAAREMANVVEATKDLMDDMESPDHEARDWSQRVCVKRLRTALRNAGMGGGK